MIESEGVGLGWQVREGLETLRQYRRHCDAKREERHAAAAHGWTSPNADALRRFAVGW